MSISGYDAWKLATPPEHEGVEDECEHEWETVDEGGGGSEFQPPDPRIEKCCLCGRRREG